MRLIDADALLKKAIPKNPEAQFRCVSVNDIINAPTIKEQPKTGEWNMCYDDDAPQDGIWLCSVCGYARLVDDISPQRFCPNCGAKMKDGDEHESC